MVLISQLEEGEVFIWIKEKVLILLLRVCSLTKRNQKSSGTCWSAEEGMSMSREQVHGSRDKGQYFFLLSRVGSRRR